MLYKASRFVVTDDPKVFRYENAHNTIGRTEADHYDYGSSTLWHDLSISIDDGGSGRGRLS